MSILSYLNHDSVEFIDNIVRRWSSVVVPFIAKTNEFKPVAQAFGSGFIVRVQDQHWLVTAFHVVNDVKRHGTCVINVDGKGLLLEDLPFVYDEKNDIAVARIDKLLMENHFGRVVAIEIDVERDESSAIGFHILMGYPGSKNRMHLEPLNLIGSC